MKGLIPEDWFAAQVEQADRTDGDIDTLSNRIAHIRTWTFVSNRREWLKDPDHWQSSTREIEDRLSDALHEQLTQRFVDKRTSVLMKSMRDKDSLFAEIEKDGKRRRRKALCGQARRLPLHAGCGGGRRSRQGGAQCSGESAGARAGGASGPARCGPRYGSYADPRGPDHLGKSGDWPHRVRAKIR